MEIEDIQLSEINFYENLFFKEIERSGYYDKIIQFPTTLIFVLIGGTFYSFNSVYPFGIMHGLSYIDWIFIILSVLFAILTLLTIIYLFKVFHGFTRRYYYLPYAKELKNREQELLKFVMTNKDALEVSTDEEILKEAKALYDNDLLNYYIEGASTNQLINDNRAKYYARARNLLFFDIGLFTIIGVLGIIMN